MNLFKFSLNTFAIEFGKVFANRLYSHRKQSVKKTYCIDGVCEVAVSVCIELIEQERKNIESVKNRVSRFAMFKTTTHR